MTRARAELVASMLVGKCEQVVGMRLCEENSVYVRVLFFPPILKIFSFAITCLQIVLIETSIRPRNFFSFFLYEECFHLNIEQLLKLYFTNAL